MNCDRARRLFGACWDDELTQAERDGLEGHLGSCPRCRAEYDEFSLALEVTASLPRIEASAGFMDRVVARARRSTAAPDIVGTTGVRWVPIAAAAAAVLVVAVVLLGPRLQWKSPAVDRPSQMVAIEGPREPVLVPQPTATSAGRPAAVSRANSENLFDPDKNVEFILDPVKLHRGRATVDRRPVAEGQEAIISF
jgi:anti-sigma factor RsiW